MNSAVKGLLGNDIWLYLVHLAISLTILSHEGCKSEISILDFDEFLPAKFDQRKNITPLSIFAVKRFFNVPYTKRLLVLESDNCGDSGGDRDGSLNDFNDFDQNGGEWRNEQPTNIPSNRDTGTQLNKEVNVATLLLKCRKTSKNQCPPTNRPIEKLTCQQSRE